MDRAIPADAVIVSEESFNSSTPYDIVQSNIDFLNALREEYFTVEELSEDALRSYYVDYYLAQVENGGFSQFVYNSRWDADVIQPLREGLRAIGASRHLAVLDEGARLVEQLGKGGLADYFASEYFGDNAVRDSLDAPNDAFSNASKLEDLVALNAAWLKTHPRLVKLDGAAARAEISRRADALPDRAERVKKARANEPRYFKLIRKLCEAAGHTLDRVTAGDNQREYNGQKTMAWHFLTDQGHHHMVDAGDVALMFRGRSTTDIVVKVDARDVV